MDFDVPKYYKGIDFITFAKIFSDIVNDLKLPQDVYMGLSKSKIQQKIDELISKNKINKYNYNELDVIVRFVIINEVIEKIENKYNNIEIFGELEIKLLSNFNILINENQKCKDKFKKFNLKTI